MKIQVLGTRGQIEPSAPYHARHSAVLIDDTLMFDVGEEEFLNFKPAYIFITHLHPDHAFFVRGKGSKIFTDATIYAPEFYKDLPIHSIKETMICGPYTITPIPTEHSIKVKSQAYIVQKGLERILYTGDLFWIDKKYQKKLNNLDMVITEASFVRKGGAIRRDKVHDGKPFGHAGVPDLMRLFSTHTKRMLLMHFGSWFYHIGARKARSELKKLAASYELDLIIGYDGLTIHI